MNTKSYTYSTANLSDLELKEQGNNYFTLKNYDDAINCYTKAIVSEFHSKTFFKNNS